MIMELLKTFTDPVYPEPEYEIQNRPAARVVIVDENWLIPIVHAENYDYYKIPGGGIDEWETQIEWVKREAMEECWCEVEILGEIGKTEEQRWATTYSWTHNLLQTSYGYYGKVNSKWDTEFTGSEIKEWFKLLWLTYEEALDRFQNCSPRHEEWVLMNERDMLFLQEWYKLIKKLA